MVFLTHLFRTPPFENPVSTPVIYYVMLFLFADDCMRTSSTLRRGLTSACGLLRKDVWVDSQHQENRGVEAAGPKQY